MNIEVFDPVLCCSTGVCGPQVDPALARAAGDLRWLQDNGHQVRRHNLGQDPAAFAANELVRAELTRSGEAALPLTLVDGRIVARGRYASREELLASAPRGLPARLPAIPSTPAGAPKPAAPTDSCCGGRDSCC